MAHRLAWLYMIGNWPSDKIDHVNRVRDDNRWCNLRSCNSHENGRNVRVSANNKTGFKGVHYSMKAKKFKSSIRTDVGRLYLGYFATAEQAFEAYKSASKLYHGDFYCEQ